MLYRPLTNLQGNKYTKQIPKIKMKIYPNTNPIDPDYTKV